MSMQIILYVFTFNLDQMLMKRFCEDVLRLLDKLGAGECSLKGFLTHKLYTVRKNLKASSPFSLELNGDKDQSTPLV